MFILSRDEELRNFQSRIRMSISWINYNAASKAFHDVLFDVATHRSWSTPIF